MRNRLDQPVRKALRTLADSALQPPLAELEPGIERARDTGHGDFASNVAMRAAKVARMPPRELAQKIVDALDDDAIVDRVEIAGPGFINFRIAPGAWHETLKDILSAKRDYGRSAEGERGRVLVEYLSANPTGPLHVGHGRHAAFGASLAEILRAAGFSVDEEYYVNDAGRQMDILALSVWLRYANELGASIEFPGNGYKGDYVRAIASRLAEAHGGRFLAPAGAIEDTVATFGDDEEKNLDARIESLKAELGDDDFGIVFDFGLNEILADIRNDLEEFGAAPGQWFSERTLTESDAIVSALGTLEDKGFLYRKDGPTWFRSTDFGDDKDRVVIRENGVSTYFASDIAYHIDKFERGYDYLINVFGSDHHGYVTRVKAAVAAAGNDPERLEFRLVQFVVLFRGEQKVQMSTREGEFVTLRELRNEVGNDAARLFYVSRSNDQHLDFDLELATAQTADNPVYYIQYAHARVARVLERLEAGIPSADSVDFGKLDTEPESALIKMLSRYPEIVELAASGRAPQHIVHYLRDLAAAFHAYYNEHKILTDDTTIRNARVLLSVATQQVIRNGLELLGVSAPSKM